MVTVARGEDENADLVQKIYDAVPLDPSKQTAAQRAFELLYRVNASILWNGFHGYFDHGNLAEVPEVLDALRLIHADPYVELFTRAVAASGRREVLEEISSIYYEAPEDLYVYMAHYARENPGEFPFDAADDA